MSNKLKKTRIVTVKEDFVSKKGKVLLAKGRVIAMHVRTAEKIKARGAKVDIKTFDIENERAKAKKAFQERERSKAAAIWS